jgi:hypothetical protein
LGKQQAHAACGRVDQHHVAGLDGPGTACEELRGQAGKQGGRDLAIRQACRHRDHACGGDVAHL